MVEPLHFLRVHAALEGNMAKHKKNVSADNALREFYEACGLSPAIIEGAIKARHEPSTTMTNRDNATAEMMAKRLREQIIDVKAPQKSSRRRS
jgi:hypothetical protein